MLKFILFENGEIYIMSSNGNQSQETFLKMESITFKRINSLDPESLTDVFATETVKSPANKTGFSHNPSSFKVMSYNGSYIRTLNGDADGNRSKRASLVIFDEAGFCTEELLAVGLAFITQDSEFKTSTNKNFKLDAEFLKCPTQVLYCSSSSSTDTTFYSKYKEYAMKMFMGDRRYFCADIPCDIPLAPHMNGEKHPPLLKKEQIDNEMRINPQKALREYYNKFETDGGITQMIKKSALVRNSIFDLPILFNETGSDKFAIAYDPARSKDGSNVGVMRIMYSKKIGYYGEIVNDVNLIDLGKKKRMMMKSQDQARYVRNMILDYNGVGNPDYENIECFMIDAGAGGGGTSYADHFLEDWTDDDGNVHKGFIDTSYHLYEEEGKNYPNASDIIKLVSPQKYRDIMCEHLIEMISLDVIKFPKEYMGKGYIIETEDTGTGDNATRTLKEKKLTFEEELALINIDAMKSEVTSIHRITSDGKTKYKLPVDKEKKGYHDDRFYCLLMLSEFLYEKRRKDKLGKNNIKKHNWKDYLMW